MILQTDVIPSMPGYPGDLYARMMARRTYIREVPGVVLNEDVLPMCSSLCYMRPYALSQKAMVIQA